MADHPQPILHRVRAMSLGGFHHLAVWEWGAGAPGVPVICVHGLTRQARDFDTLAATLVAQGRRVLCIDIVGRGRSDWLRDPAQYHLLQYAADVNTVLAWAHVDQVDWVGTSLGGLIGMTLAAQPGAPLRRMVLNDIGPYIPASALMRIGRYIGTGPQSFASLDAAQAHLQQILAPYGALDAWQWRHLAEHSYRHDPAQGHWVARHDPAIARTYRQWQFLSVDLWRGWKAVACPVLVMRGASSDFLSADVVDRMCRQRSDVQHIEVPGCGHAPSLLAAAQVEPIARFLS
ncbi:MAG: alpha/beta hydrolase [Burkholderiales bacterium]